MFFNVVFRFGRLLLNEAHTSTLRCRRFVWRGCCISWLLSVRCWHKCWLMLLCQCWSHQTRHTLNKKMYNLDRISNRVFYCDSPCLSHKYLTGGSFQFVLQRQKSHSSCPRHCQSPGRRMSQNPASADKCHPTPCWWCTCTSRRCSQCRSWGSRDSWCRSCWWRWWSHKLRSWSRSRLQILLHNFHRSHLP